MFKLKTAGALSLLLILAGCSNSKPSIIVSGNVTDRISTLCVKGTGYTPNGSLRLSILMPPYTINGQAGPNPLTNPPFGNTVATAQGTFQATLNLSGRSEANCGTSPSEPDLFLVDQTTLGIGAVGLPPGFMCGNVPAPASFGDPSACQP